MSTERLARCPVCRKWFHTVNPNKIYCRDECRFAHRAEKDKVTKESGTCPVCGKMFEKKRKDQIYCCTEHRLEAEYERRGRNGKHE